MKYIFTFLFVSLPVLSLAQGNSLFDLTFSFQRVLGSLVGLIIGIAVLVFLWGMIKYIWNGADEKSRAEGKQFMVWGIVGLFVMVSVWGLVEITAQIFGFHLVPGLSPLLPNLQR